MSLVGRVVEAAGVEAASGYLLSETVQRADHPTRTHRPIEHDKASSEAASSEPRVAWVVSMPTEIGRRSGRERKSRGVGSIVRC
jgi:hypothetical protein